MRWQLSHWHDSVVAPNLLGDGWAQPDVAGGAELALDRRHGHHAPLLQQLFVLGSGPWSRRPMISRVALVVEPRDFRVEGLPFGVQARLAPSSASRLAPRALASAALISAAMPSAASSRSRICSSIASFSLLAVAISWRSAVYSWLVLTAALWSSKRASRVSTTARPLSRARGGRVGSRRAAPLRRPRPAMRRPPGRRSPAPRPAARPAAVARLRGGVQLLKSDERGELGNHGESVAGQRAKGRGQRQRAEEKGKGRQEGRGR